MPTIEYSTIDELQAIVAQFQDFNQRQGHAKRLCGNAIKQLRDAETLFLYLTTEAAPGGALEQAAPLTGGWLGVPLAMSDKERTIAEAIMVMVAKLDELHRFMADFDAAYQATGHGQFFTDLPEYTG